MRSLAVAPPEGIVDEDEEDDEWEAGGDPAGRDHRRVRFRLRLCVDGAHSRDPARAGRGRLPVPAPANLFLAHCGRAPRR